MNHEGSSISQAFLDSIQPVVLVGGKSRRFGRDKLVEPWNGKLLVQYPIDALRGVFGARVKVVGECDPRVPTLADGMISDLHPGVGPIGGILSAFDLWNGPLFVLAGDMPSVASADIRLLVAAAQQNDPAAAVLALTDRVHPCFGFYRSTARPALLSCLNRRELRLAGAIPEPLVATIAVSRDSAANVNCQADCGVPSERSDLNTLWRRRETTVPPR